MINEKIEEMQPFASRLKALRKELRKSQAEMAAVLDCTPNHYQKIEYVPATNLMILADYFGVTTDYLLGRE